MTTCFDSEVQNLLAAWGHWVLADGTGLEYSSPMARLIREHVGERSKTRTTLFITDDQALRVENLITTLCQYKPVEGKVLQLRYVENMSDSAIAKYYLTPLKYGEDNTKKVSAYQAAKHIANAEGFIAGLMISEVRKEIGNL